jgi:hypothetical protein
MGMDGKTVNGETLYSICNIGFSFVCPTVPAGYELGLGIPDDGLSECHGGALLGIALDCIAVAGWAKTKSGGRRKDGEAGDGGKIKSNRQQTARARVRADVREMVRWCSG